MKKNELIAQLKNILAYQERLKAMTTNDTTEYIRGKDDGNIEMVKFLIEHVTAYWSNE